MSFSSYSSGITSAYPESCSKSSLFRLRGDPVLLLISCVLDVLFLGAMNPCRTKNDTIEDDRNSATAVLFWEESRTNVVNRCRSYVMGDSHLEMKRSFCRFQQVINLMW